MSSAFFNARCMALSLASALGACTEADEPRQRALDASVMDAHTLEQPRDASVAPMTVAAPDFCARPGDDAVRHVFCSPTPPRIASLQDLLSALDFDLNRSVSTGYGDGTVVAARDDYERISGVRLTLAAVLLGHSTALSGRVVSQINPRAILIGADTLIAFQRGVQQIELASRSLVPGAFERYNFYLVSFRQACSEADAGCSPGDLYTHRVEVDWTSVRVEDDEQLKNTPADCRQCHQRGSESPILLMREFDGPWLHFFGADRDDVEKVFYPEPTGVDLVRDYRYAKVGESYATIPVATLRGTTALSLELRCTASQPLLFPSIKVLNERWPLDADGGWAAAPQPTPSWEQAYQAFQRGEQLALPYFEARATDPEKLRRVSDAYRSYLDGGLGAAELPDLADVYPDDPKKRAAIGLQNLPGASPAQALVQTCGSCHNDVLDQTISRARFNIDLAKMSAAEREVAIDRLGRPATDPLAMPPAGGRQLDANARAALVEYLRGDTRSPEDAALLSRAARLGMAVVPEYRAY